MAPIGFTYATLVVVRHYDMSIWDRYKIVGGLFLSICGLTLPLEDTKDALQATCGYSFWMDMGGSQQAAVTGRLFL
jgi:hypothetical protein